MRKNVGNHNDHNQEKPAPAAGCCFVWTGLIVIGILLLAGIVSATAPIADFTCIPDSPGSLKVVCTDQSVRNPTEWAWYFGDETYSGPWVLMNESTPWSRRIAQASVALNDGDIVAIGGSILQDPDPRSCSSEVWLSYNEGRTWVLVNNDTERCRMSFSAVALPDNTILVIGGIGGSDIWQSANKGSAWSRVTKGTSVEWRGRQNLSAVAVGPNTIVIFGGQDGADILNDTWISSDGGVTWSNITTSEGPAWYTRTQQSSVYDQYGHLIMTGGMENGGAIMNDVWITNTLGDTWTAVKDNNPNTEWKIRKSHTTLVMPDDSILLFGGSSDRGFKDIWRSTDFGATWKLVNDTPWNVNRSDNGNVVLPNGKIVVIGGYDNLNKDLRDVWSLDPVGSRTQNSPHEYAGEGTYRVTLRALNTEGYSTVQKDVSTGSVGDYPFFITIKPVPEIHVGDKFTINATTNLPSGMNVLVEVCPPDIDRNTKSPSGEFSCASGTMKVQAGSTPMPACCWCQQTNFTRFDIDSSTFKPGVYLINATALGIPQLGRSYFYVREGGNTVTPLDPVIILCGIVGACGIVHLLRKRYQ